jgi:hypothetical protein
VRQFAGRIKLNRMGLLFIVLNLALLIIAHYAPGLLGDNRVGEFDSTRLMKLMQAVNYPVFWIFANANVYPSPSTLKMWSTARFFAFNLFIFILLVFCLLAYWYIQGLLVKLLVRNTRLALTKIREKDA